MAPSVKGQMMQRPGLAIDTFGGPAIQCSLLQGTDRNDVSRAVLTLPGLMLV